MSISSFPLALQKVSYLIGSRRKACQTIRTSSSSGSLCEEHLNARAILKDKSALFSNQIRVKIKHPLRPLRPTYAALLSLQRLERIREAELRYGALASTAYQVESAFASPPRVDDDTYPPPNHCTGDERYH